MQNMENLEEKIVMLTNEVKTKLFIIYLYFFILNIKINNKL